MEPARVVQDVATEPATAERTVPPVCGTVAVNRVSNATTVFAPRFVSAGMVPAILPRERPALLARLIVVVKLDNAARTTPARPLMIVEMARVRRP